jgi:hypothetical protein
MLLIYARLVSKQQLREGLECAGAVFDDREFDIVLSKVPAYQFILSFCSINILMVTGACHPRRFD